LIGLGYRVEILDGDIIRTNLSKGLGFSREDRIENLKRIGFVCKLLSRNGVIAIVAAITPYQEAREYNRAEIENYVEVFVNCPIEECIQRDPKGLYKKALSGEIAQFTGISDPFEIPLKPEIEITTNTETPEDSSARILKTLEILGHLPMTGENVSFPFEQGVRQRLTALGYLRNGKGHERAITEP